MLKDMYCEKCQIKLDKAEAANLRWHIKFGYRNNWIIDNLPSASLMTIWSGEKRRRYSGGFPIGFMDPEKKQPYLYNHVNIYIDYYALGDDGYRVIGFAVEPLSVHHKFEGDYDWDGESVEGMNKTLNTCPSIGLLRSNSIREFQVVKAGQKILFTYGVTFIPSEVEWTSRWDVYLSEDHLVPDQVHSYSISNSVIFVLCLTLFLIRNLRREIAAHNALATLAAEEQNKDKFPSLYCVFLGSGVQIAVTAFFAIVFSAAGYLSPARRGSLMNAILIFYVLSGSLAGYTSSYMYKAFQGKQRQICSTFTATLVPGIAFTTFLFLNISFWILHYTNSTPIYVVLIVAALWFFVSVPMVFVGSYFGDKQDPIEFPTVTSTIERAIPSPAAVHCNG